MMHTNERFSFRAAASILGIAAVFGFGTNRPAQAAPPAHRITIAQAEKSALKRYKNGRINGRTALENEEGKWQYAVMVKSGGKIHEVMVDAVTGKIASEEIVTAKEEAAEKRAEAAQKKHSGNANQKEANKGEKEGKGEKD